MLCYQSHQQQYKAYGGWTWVFGDFYAVNFTENLLSPTLEPLAAIIDPLMYKENLTMPKLVVDATGDECKHQCTSFKACMSPSCLSM